MCTKTTEDFPQWDLAMRGGPEDSAPLCELVVRICRRRVRSQDADDVAQTITLRVLKMIQAERRQPQRRARFENAAQFERYISVAAGREGRRCAIQGDAAHPMSVEVAVDAPSSQATLRAERALILMRCIRDHLTGKQRESMKLAAQGLLPREIAARLRLEAAQVHQALHHGRANLRRIDSLRRVL